MARDFLFFCYDSRVVEDYNAIVLIGFFGFLNRNFHEVSVNLRHEENSMKSHDVTFSNAIFALIDIFFKCGGKIDGFYMNIVIASTYFPIKNIFLLIFCNFLLLVTNFCIFLQSKSSNFASFHEVLDARREKNHFGRFPDNFLLKVS